jgi:hypothetical protein
VINRIGPGLVEPEDGDQAVAVDLDCQNDADPGCRLQAMKEIGLHERVMALKQQQRDERALKEGRRTAEELNRKNSAFGPGFAESIKLDLSKKGWAR